MSDPRPHRSVPVLLALGLLWPVAAHAQEAPASTLDGVYTIEQATVGKDVYELTCSECHALDEFGEDMMLGWAGATLYDLWDLIVTTMPDDSPGSLPAEDYAAAMAYILQLNGMPPGEMALPAEADRLRTIVLEATKVP